MLCYLDSDLVFQIVCVCIPALEAKCFGWEDKILVV